MINLLAKLALCEQVSNTLPFHSALKYKTGHLGGVAEDDIPKNTLEIWARSLNPLYVILSIPAKMSSIFKMHRDQGTVHRFCMAHVFHCHVLDHKKAQQVHEMCV